MCCPGCGNMLKPADNCEFGDCNDDVASGSLDCVACGKSYPIIRGIPRFVGNGNYTQSFGYQWNKFSKTQLDEYLGIPLSEVRFADETKWPRSLKGQLVLEAGSGMGRFTRCAAETGAEVFSFDYSMAIEANYNNNKQLANVHFLQADICRPPFPRGAFDKVFCFGVLQHTPDPKKSFYSLLSLVKQNGDFVADVYRKSWKTIFWGQYYLRVITKRIPADRLW